MIDLSFLTEEEQEAIMKVLQRDADLKRAEDERVRHLAEKIKDEQQLKNMSGRWFYEAKAKRHKDKIHGADIVRASMRKKRPQIAEHSKDRENRTKESWVNNVNKDALLTPELAGVIEEPEEDAAPTSPSSSVANLASPVIGMSQENTRKSLVSQAKQRKNPFNNSKLPEDHLSLQTKNEQSKNGRAGLFQTSKEGELSESKEKSSILDISSQNLEQPKQTFQVPVNESQIKPPIPKARKMIYKSTNLKQSDNQSFPRQWTDSLSARGAPRGILKRNSSSSSTDSETIRLNQNFESKSKIVSPGLIIHERISEKEHSLEDDSCPNSLEPFKHVRFSAVKDELPQSPGLIHGQEVGEFSVLEPDRLKNVTKDAEDIDEFRNDPAPFPYGKSLPFLHQSASSPSASKNETHQPTTSDSFPISGPHSHSEVLTTRPQSIENSLTINEQEAKLSELCRSPADEPSQVPGDSSRDHQQGKPPLLMALKAETSSRSGPHATEIMKTNDDSISKVLDWFNRSSGSDDKTSLKHLQGIESKEKTDSKSQMAIAMVTDHTSLKENGSKALYATQVELKPMTSDSTCQVEGNLLPSRNYQDNDMKIKSKSVNLSQQVSPKEDPGILQPFESCSPSQGNKNMDYSLGSKSTVEGNGVFSPTSDSSYSVLKGSDAEYQVPYNIKDVGSLGIEGPKFHICGKNKGNSEVNFDSSTIVKEQSLKDNMKAERKSKGGDTYILKTSLESENIESPSETANYGSPWKKAEVQLQKEASELPKNQMQQEKYKRVSDRISFWEGVKAAAKLTHKDPTSSCSQGQPSAETHQLVKSQSEYNQVTAKQVVLDEDGQAAPTSSLYSSNKPKETRLQVSVPSKDYPSADKSGKVYLFQSKINEPKKIFPAADSLHSGRDITLPALQQTSTGRNEVHTPLEKDLSQIGEPHPNFKVLSLKKRMDETNTEQAFNQSQFENLRNFWDLGTNSNGKANVEKTITTPSHKNSMTFNSQKHKEFSDIKSPGENTHEEEVLPSQKKGLERQEMGKLNSTCIPQVLSDETTFPWRPPRKSIHQLPGNESSKKNIENNMEWFITPVFKEENDYLDQEIEESIVKTSVLSKDYKDTFNDSLQKLLSETSSPVIQPSGGKVHVEQMLELGVSENRTWPQKIDLADAEEEAKQPKEIINEHIEKTVAPPKVEHNTLTASLDKLLKEATGISPSPLQTSLEPVTTRTNSQTAQSRFFEKGMEQSHGTLAHQREITALFPEREETLGNTAVPQKVESGECQLNTENLLQMIAEASHPLEQPPHLHKKSYLGGEANSPQDLPSSWDAQRETSQKEISETVEKVILPPKTALNDINTALQKLLREALLSYSAEGEVVPGEVKAEFPEGVQAAGSEEEPRPVLKTLEKIAARKMPSKSLEDISSDSSNQAKVDNLPEELIHSAEDDQKADQEPDTNECIPRISTVPSQPDNQFSHPDKLRRMSKSVPAFLQDESDGRETDTTSESSYQLSRHKKSPSSLTNLSSSSGMTSLSSVSGSVMSVYSGDFGNLEVKGNIQFAVDYVESLKELHVFVAQCKDLAAADVKKQRSDPYVKTYLLPDKGKMGKKKTLVVKKTLNPVYNEILRYKIEKQILKTQKLNLSVWHRDTFKRNSFLGEVELDLETWDWDNKQNKQLKWYPLKRKTAPLAVEAENRGEMKLALQYVPEPIPGKKLLTTGEVHIWVKECLDLPLLRGSHLNSFVKCTILPDTSRKSRQKTRAVGKTTNPVFNHTMVYDGFRPEDLTEACVELTVWDHYKLTNQFLGGLRIGFGAGKSYGIEVDWMDSTSEEVALWEKMVNSPNTWIEATLPLRMLLIAKISK
ncbi:synaptotagmin-like protein 2 isoform X2 [Choloepus didactylus]|uniref:synaptotagmin-like protein 2 isoform X2 n=1 Tax=Choloepus didactylus TaxID=27675 RepID=UPI00189CA7AD|nr:synaptotagmin-like protein 2 isoform X2 [Choloepus didactylus]